MTGNAEHNRSAKRRRQMDGQTDDKYSAISGEEMNVVVESRHRVHFCRKIRRFNCSVQCHRQMGNQTDGRILPHS